MMSNPRCLSKLIQTIFFIGFITHVRMTKATSRDTSNDRNLSSITSFNDLTDAVSANNASSHIAHLSRNRRHDPGVGCIMPHSMSNGTYKLLGSVFVEEGDRAPHNSILQLICPPGYASSHSGVNFCDERNNRWFLDLPTCLKTCKPPKSSTVEFTCMIPSINGQTIRESCDRPAPSGTYASSKCRNGHHSISNSRNILCIDGRWRYSMPKCTPECGKTTPEGMPNVINGTNAARGEFPWHVAVYSTFGQTKENRAPTMWCGGSIISRSFVISAAHCFYDPYERKAFDLELFTIVAGKLYSEFFRPEESLDPYIQKTAIKNIEIPIDYEAEASSYTHDLALLTLETPLNFSDLIMPICLNLVDKEFDETQSSPGVKGKVSGFGLTDVNGDISDILRTANMPIISKMQCKSESPEGFSKYIVWDKLCAGYTTGIGVCGGDSGGGLVVSSTERNQVTWYLRGIVSTSPASDQHNRCSTNTYATFTRPFLHREFIGKVLNREGCTMPKNPENGQFILAGDQNKVPGELVGYQSQITLKCDKGFTPSTAESNVCDEFTDDWVEEHPICNDHYKIVCYFGSWAFYKKGRAKFIPEDIDAGLCTHIVYSFAVLDEESLVMKSQDPWADFDNKLYERVTAYKNKDLKVSISLGGWDDSGDGKYSRLVNDPKARKNFIDHAIRFLQSYNFDGLDLHWKYPTCWQADCSKGPQSDKAAFATLVHELSEAFKPFDFSLSAAVPASDSLIDAGFDVPSLAADLDWLSVLAYDFHGSWESTTGHVAALYYHPDDEISVFNANYSIHYWIEKGAPSRKLLLGMPFHGRSFTLNTSLDTPPGKSVYENDRGLYLPAIGGGAAGEYTKTEGILAYYEICDRIKNHGWTVVQDERGRTGPHAYKDDQWVSYDDRAMIRKKSKFVKSLNLGGAMVWSLDQDDFTNKCGEGAYPQLNQIRDILQAEPGKYSL